MTKKRVHVHEDDEGVFDSDSDSDVSLTAVPFSVGPTPKTTGKKAASMEDFVDDMDVHGKKLEFNEGGDFNADASFDSSSGFGMELDHNDDDGHDDDHNALDMDVDMDPEIAHRHSKEWDEEVVDAPTPKKKTPKKKSALKKSSGNRRKTMDIMQNPVEAGLIDSLERPEGPRRSRRVRFQPLQYWKNERVIYERLPNDIGYLLPTIKLNELHPPNPSPVKIKRKRKTSSSAGQKGRKKHSVREGAESSDDEEYSQQCDPRGMIYDYRTQTDVRKVLVAFPKMSSLGVLPHPSNDDGTETQTEEKFPRAAVFHDDKDYSQGILVLPPGGKKFEELSEKHEIFFVASAKPNSVEVRIGTETYILSKGCSFVVPPHNVYYIYNRSETSKVKLQFTLVRPRKPKK